MLSKERIAELKMYFTRCVQSRSLSTVVHLAECGLELIEMVEALQQENERLNAALDKAVDMIGDNSRCPTEYEPNEKRDPDNIMAGQKFILDALVHAGVIPNDSQKYIAGIVHRFRVDKQNPRVEVEIIDATKIENFEGQELWD